MTGSVADDPFPVGTTVQVTDYDSNVLGPFTVVRSYWPSPVAELTDPTDPDRGMIRQNHDRIFLAPERTT